MSLKRNGSVNHQVGFFQVALDGRNSPNLMTMVNAAGLARVFHKCSGQQSIMPVRLLKGYAYRHVCQFNSSLARYMSVQHLIVINYVYLRIVCALRLHRKLISFENC